MASAVLQLALVVYLTRIFSPADYGTYALFISSYAIAITIFVNPLRHVLVRFLQNDGKTDAAILAKVSALFLASTIIALPFLWVARVMPITENIHGEIFLILFLCLIAGGFVEIALDYNRRKLRPIPYCILFVLRSVAQCSCVVGGYLLLNSVTGAIMGMLFGFFIALMCSMFFIPFKSLLTRRNMSEIAVKTTDVLKYGVPLAVAELFSLALIYTDRFMLAVALGPEATGYLASAHDIVWPAMNLLAVIIYMAFFPLLLEKRKEKRKSKNQAEFSAILSQGTGLLLCVTIAGASGIFLLSTSITNVLIGPVFREFAPILIQLIAAGFVFFVIKTFLLDMAFALSEDTRPLLFIGSFILLINIGLNYALIQRFGLVGAPIATLCCFIIACFITLGVIVKKRKFEFALNIVDIGKIFIATICMAMVLPQLPDSQTGLDLFMSIAAGAFIFLLPLYVLKPTFLAFMERPH